MTVFYKAHYWDDYNMEEKEERGIVFGDSSDLIQKLERYYGKDNISSVTFEWTENSDLDLITEEMITHFCN